jgi:hypothetical protein
MRSMDAFVEAAQLTPDQYRARAEIVRSTADSMTREAMRRQLLRIAEDYELLADSMERAHLRVISETVAFRAGGDPFESPSR